MTEGLDRLRGRPALLSAIQTAGRGDQVSKAQAEELRQWWARYGLDVEVENVEEARFPCTEPGCDAGPFETPQKRGAHRRHAHGARVRKGEPKAPVRDMARAASGIVDFPRTPREIEMAQGEPYTPDAEPPVPDHPWHSPGGWSRYAEALIGKLESADTFPDESYLDRIECALRAAK